MTRLSCDILCQGSPGTGNALVLDAPISFWGGVEPESGIIQDVRHPQCGLCMSGGVVFLLGTIGSSSASSVLLELVRSGNAPAALVLHEPDAILLLGLIVAREMGWKPPIAVRLDRDRFALYRGSVVSVSREGVIERAA